MGLRAALLPNLSRQSGVDEIPISEKRKQSLMETFLIKAFQLITALAFLVIIHEFGHYIFARIFGIKVEKFYMFFNPWFSLFKWKPKKKKVSYDRHGNEVMTWRDTEYGIGWLPLGGYCKIAGMIDESMDTEQMKQEPKSWEFRSKPAYQRLLVMIGGVLFNFILAVAIYAGIVFCWGHKYIPFDKATEGFDYVEAAQKAGFRNGDIPISADGVKLDAMDGDFMLKMAEAAQVKVLRGLRDTVTIDIPENFIFRLNDDKGFLSYRIPVYIKQIVNGEAADKAGLKVDDRIIAIDTVKTPSYTELEKALSERAGKSTVVTVQRGDSILRLNATLNEFGKLGFQLKALPDVYQAVTVNYNIFESVPKGWELGYGMLANYVGSMKHVFTREGANSIGGFGAIGSMFPETWSWYSFWNITAFLSVALAFMNIIPIPGLDGGHVVFLLWEIITRRKPSEKVLIVSQYIGMALLFLLLVYANGNDILRALR